MRPIRFCLLTTFYPPWHFGGDAIHVARLARVLVDGGHEVTVVHSPRAHRMLARDRPEPLAPQQGVTVVALDESVGSLVGNYLTGRPVRARGQLERLLGPGFDVLHFHNPSLLGAPALLGMGDAIKLYTAHEQWLLCPSHVLWRRSRGVCQDPPCRSCELTHLRPPQLWRRSGLLARSVGQLDALIAPSRASAELHRRFQAQTRVEVLEHFVPDPAATPVAGDAQDRPSRPYFLYAGRLEPIKGVRTLIEAFRRRRSEDLVIAGDGGLVRSLRRAAADLPHVRFTGWLARPQLDFLQRDALAVLVPTLGHEAFGLAAVEGFAHGTPAIVHRFGALAELADSTGAALSFDTPAELDAALERLACDTALRDALGARAREVYMERFTADRHLARYLSMVEQLARERGDDELAARAQAREPSAAGR